MVDNRLHLALDRELAEGERVIWQAAQAGRVETSGFLIYIFAVPWTGFSIMWTILAAAGASQMGDESFGWIGLAFPLFGVPFILVGLAMLSAPWIPLFQKGRVLYAVTNRRVLRISLGRELVVKSLPGKRIGLIERRESRDGTGLLKLAAKVGEDSDGDARTEFFEVGRIADVKGAHDAIDELAKRARTELNPISS